MVSRELSSWPSRAASVLVFGLGAGAVAALLEASWVAAQTGAWLAAFQAELGILMLLSFGVSLAVLGGSACLHGKRAPLEHLDAWLTGLEPKVRHRWLLVVPLALFLLLVGFVVLTVGSTAALSTSGSPEAAGVNMGLYAVLLALVLGGAAVALTRNVTGRSVSVASVYTSWGLSGLGFGGIFLALVLIGTTSGQGHSYHALGVFRRQELDLRALTLLSGIALSAFVSPLRVSVRSAWGLLISCCLATLSLTFFSGKHGFGTAGNAQAVERYAPLSKLALGPLRKLTDRDHDGFSAWFGGGDCNDQEAKINPAGDDVPGNGVDEDCSGRDAVRVEEPPPMATPAVQTPPNPTAIPRDLNVIVITVDTLRANLGYVGYERALSPNLDKLAEKSLIFENAYCLASYTSKSLAPMLIGKYASETDLGFRHFNRFGKEDRFVPERIFGKIRTLSAQSYWYFHEPGYGFERGFDLIDDRAAPTKHIIEGDQTSNGDELTDNAIAILKDPTNTAQRFYMWVHYVDPHAEYVAHSEFDFGRMGRERYDGEIAFVDHHLGRLLEFIEKSPLGKNTAIVFTSDHGEAFGEHGMYRHGYELWEELVRVPLLVHVPGVTPQRIRTRRSIIDVAPTLLELLDAPAPSGVGTDFVSGVSLLADIGQKEPAARPIFIDMSAGPYNEERQALIEHDLKLVMSDGRVLSLFNLADDPGEKKDLSANQELKEQALARFKAFKKKLREVPLKRKAD